MPLNIVAMLGGRGLKATRECPVPLRRGQGPGAAGAFCHLGLIACERTGVSRELTVSAAIALWMPCRRGVLQIVCLGSCC